MRYLSIFLFLATITISCQSEDQVETDPLGKEFRQNYDATFDSLVWSDEFDGEGIIDTMKWFHQTQIPEHGEWWGGIIQHYTDRVENTYLSEGNLNLVQKRKHSKIRDGLKSILLHDSIQSLHLLMVE